MYGRKASQLLKEFKSSEPGQLTSFNNDVFAQVIEECDGHGLHMQALIRKAQEEGSNYKTIKNPDFSGCIVHHLSLIRNKRCLMAYVYNRAEVIQNLGWAIKELPNALKEKLSNDENEYFEKHSATLQSCISDLDLDLFVDMVPPKDPYIKVRVLEEIGDGIMLGEQVANLAMHAILFVKRANAEMYISQGKMEELTS